jgi:uncharacterized iron-regulated protein
MFPASAEPCPALQSASAPQVVGTWKPACAHVLCGMVFDTRTASKDAGCASGDWQPVLAALKTTLAEGGLAALGEVHDNRAHHLLRASLIKDAKAVVFEQIRGGQQSALDASAAQATGTTEERAADLMRRVGWKASGWPVEDYMPIVAAAVAAKARVYAGDAPQDTMMALAKGTAEAVSAKERVRLKLDETMGAKLDDASLTEIGGAHCGMVPKTAFGGMAFAQRYRDAHLADAAVKAIETNGSAVLISGNTHVRTDRGVPWYVARRLPGKPIMSVMLVEVEDGMTDPKSYVPLDPDGKPAADFIVFTPRTDREDPCKKFGVKAG